MTCSMCHGTGRVAGPVPLRCECRDRFPKRMIEWPRTKSFTVAQELAAQFTRERGVLHVVVRDGEEFIAVAPLSVPPVPAAREVG